MKEECKVLPFRGAANDAHPDFVEQMQFQPQPFMHKDDWAIFLGAVGILAIAVVTFYIAYTTA